MHPNLPTAGTTSASSNTRTGARLPAGSVGESRQRQRPQDNENDQSADLVVVGSGVAGLAAGLSAADAGAHVILLTGGAPLSGSSPWAQGGVAAALGSDDSPALHAADTKRVGVGLNDAHAVDVLVHDGRDRVRDLLGLGVPFEGAAGHPDLGLEAGHSRRRILHAGGGATGRAVTTALLARAAAHPRIDLYEHTPAEMLVATGRRVTGVRSGDTIYHGRAVVLATGGYAALWGRTTNAPENRGSGLALAWWAGASLADLEFVQFHPTALALPNQPAFLLSEALRGEGALVVDADERPIVDPLLPRDVVARAIARHRAAHGAVYLSLRHLDPAHVRASFPAIADRLRAWGLDLARDLLPIAPAAHYCMGGVRTDDMGRTDVAGLYAAGEVACTGVQGANRLASNSLLECLVFGTRAAQAALHDAPARRAHWDTEGLPAPQATVSARAYAIRPYNQPAHTWRRDIGAPSSAHVDHSQPVNPALPSREEYSPRGQAPAAMGTLLDRDLGVEREGARLAALVDTLPDPAWGETPAGNVVAALAARAAVLRTESRGAHYRKDAPETQDAWRGRIHWRRGKGPRFERIAS